MNREFGFDMIESIPLILPSSTLISKIAGLVSFPNAGEQARIISGLRWIGLFSAEKVVPRAGNLLDTLCARLEGLMKYDAGERDLVMLQHKFVITRKDGTEVRPGFLLFKPLC